MAAERKSYTSLLVKKTERVRALVFSIKHETVGKLN
jgi:hypothetical protein